MPERRFVEVGVQYLVIDNGRETSALFYSSIEGIPVYFNITLEISEIFSSETIVFRDLPRVMLGSGEYRIYRGKCKID